MLSFSPRSRFILPKSTLLKLINLSVYSALFSHHNSILVNNIIILTIIPMSLGVRIVYQHNLSSYRFSVHEPSFRLLTAYSFLSYAILLLFMHAHYDTLYLFCTQAGKGPLARY